MINFSGFFKKPVHLFVTNTGLHNRNYGVFCGRPSFSGFLAKPEIIKGFKDYAVEDAGDSFGINAVGQCLLTLTKEAPEDIFLKLFDAPEVCNVTLRELELVASTMADKDVRSYLKGVFLCPTGALVSTDGHRITVVKTGTKYVPTIVPRDVILSTIKLAKQTKHKGWIAIRQFADCTGFFLGGYCVIGKNLEGSYPDYNRVLPTKTDFICTVSPTELADWLKSVAPLVKKDKYPAVCFDDAGGVFIQHDSKKIYFPGQRAVHGAEIVLNVYFDYMLKLTNMRKKDGTATLRKADNKLLLKSGNANHVIMGMRL